MHHVFLALGTNLGDKQQNIHRALDAINAQVGHILKTSSVIETAPLGFQSDNTFLNAVILCETDLLPLQLLHRTQQIERQMGRTTKSVNGIYHDRIIDIDILLYDDLTLSTPELTIPHPRMSQRDFVMTPLREISS